MIVENLLYKLKEPAAAGGIICPCNYKIMFHYTVFVQLMQLFFIIISSLPGFLHIS